MWTTRNAFIAAAVFVGLLTSACSRNTDSPTGPTAHEVRVETRAATSDCDEVPRAPDTVYASVQADQSISIAFVDLADNEDGFWIVYVRIDHRPESPGFDEPQRMHLPAHDGSGPMGAWVTENITGLESGFFYKIWIEAYNAAGTSRSKHAIGRTTIPEEEHEDLPPRPPDTVYASTNYESMISIAFRDLSDNEDAFVVHYTRLETTSGPLRFNPEQTLTLNDSNSERLGNWIIAELAGLTPGRSYRIWVEAVNGGGSAVSKTAVGVTRQAETDDRIAERQDESGWHSPSL